MLGARVLGARCQALGTRYKIWWRARIARSLEELWTGAAKTSYDHEATQLYYTYL